MKKNKNEYYIGFRIETYHQLLKGISKKSIAKYNETHTNFQIKDVCFNGKVGVKKTDNILVAKKYFDEDNQTIMSNFLLIVKQKYTKEEATRMVKIINIIGNDKLIKEYSKEFVYGDSVLKHLPDIQNYREAFLSCEEILPNLIDRSWFYAPEVY